MDDRCEICGMPAIVAPALVLHPNGTWERVIVHIACESNRLARMRAKAHTN